MWVYLNGEILDSAEAKISPLDRGFTFGEGVYEGITSYDKNFFLFNEHLDRLKSSLEKTFIPYPKELSNLESHFFFQLRFFSTHVPLTYLKSQ